MINFLVEKIVNKGIQSGCIQNEQLDIYLYGYTLLIEVSICSSASLLIAVLADRVIELIIFSTVFIPLRCFGGGFHAAKAWKCLIISFILIFLYCVCIKWTIVTKSALELIIVNSVVIFLIQKRIEGYKYENEISNKKIVTFIYTIGLVIAGILYSAQMEIYANSILIAQLVWWMSLILNCVIEKKNVKQNRK